MDGALGLGFEGEGFPTLPYRSRGCRGDRITAARPRAIALTCSRKLRRRSTFRPVQCRRHPIRDAAGDVGMIAVIVVPTRAADHDIVQVRGPLVAAEMFDSRLGDVRRDDATERRFAC